eukprot:5714749-Prymnesium_polylepis.1
MNIPGSCAGNNEYEYEYEFPSGVMRDHSKEISGHPLELLAKFAEVKLERRRQAAHETRVRSCAAPTAAVAGG